jgi:hypothetical protein
VTEKIHEEGGQSIDAMSWVTFSQEGFSWMMPYAKYESGGYIILGDGLPGRLKTVPSASP